MPKPKAKNSGRNKIFEDSRYFLGKYILDKYVDARTQNLWRDLPIVYKIIRKYPSQYFWQNLPCTKRVPSIVYFTYEKAAARLKMLYTVYKKSIKIDQSIKIKVDAPKNEIYNPEDLEIDLISPSDKPKSILDFCK